MNLADNHRKLEHMEDNIIVNKLRECLDMAEMPVEKMNFEKLEFQNVCFFEEIIRYKYNKI